MRKTILAATVLLLALVSTVPALAQTRDPFEPQPGGGDQQQTDDGSGSSERDPFNPETGGEDQPAAQETPNDPTDEPTVDPTQTSEPTPPDDDVDQTLSNTGFDTSTWSAIAYVLIVLGGTALVAARTFAPVHARRRK